MARYLLTHTGKEVDEAIDNIQSKLDDAVSDGNSYLRKDGAWVKAADAGLVTDEVGTLKNYYLKTETFTQEEINQKIGEISTVSLQVVDVKPSAGTENIIYLVPNEASDPSDNIYDEWIYTNGKWEVIGTTRANLNEYIKTTDADDKYVQDKSYVHTDKNFTETYETKLKGIEDGAQVNAVTSVAGKTGTVALTTADVSESGEKKYVTSSEKTAWNGKAEKIAISDETSTGTVTVTLDPNKYYRYSNNSGISKLTINLGKEISGIYNEYMVEFISSGKTTVVIPGTVKWADGSDVSAIEGGKKYQISIVSNLATLLSGPK